MKTTYWNRRRTYRSGFVMAVILIGMPVLTVILATFMGAL